jgi:hypothetical protein
VSEKKEKMVRKFELLILSVCGGILLAKPALAQTTVWGADSVNSTARLFVGSSNRQDARINVAVARLNGEIKQSAGDFLPGAFTFQIYPADRNAKLVQTEGRGSASHGVNGTRFTIITFTSKSVEPLDENTICVRGDLTATYTSWSATYVPTKDYSGPIYGPPVTHSMKQEVVFVFRKVAHAGAREERHGNVEWLASSTIPAEAFPVLWNAVVTTYWPTFVVEEQCVSAEAGAEDYSGPLCEGKVVEPLPRTDMHCVMASPNGNESCTGTPLAGLLRRVDESHAGGGQESGSSSQPLANEVEIQLDLHLAKANPAPPKAPATTGDPVAGRCPGVMKGCVDSGPIGKTDSPQQIAHAE